MNTTIQKGGNNMDKEKLVFSQIEKIVKREENYIPRNYKTVGGMWTVDTYKKNDVTLQLMDEGWTTKIFNGKVTAIDSGGHFKIEKGSLNELEELLKGIS